ncbi:hypothetical protein SASPL_117302 [Salvia splendens]|uniref:PB1 domain-containing protein n=1 Tax=Salvia splendens TaxID=180675 RepID=A0A8X8ZYS4_SALSN|nr:hypothetical protein SASPL_117302 [Salvia splendens]
MPVYNLPSKILFRVVNVQLKAEADTDEQDENVERKEPPPPPAAHFHVFSFCKTLTASDTSTHGGFSVLRRHADECLPPLVRTTPPKLCEVHFLGIFFTASYKVLSSMIGHVMATSNPGASGQRFARTRVAVQAYISWHFLQSGWSVFVSSKRLVARDAFIFLRGEDGELRAGVRRAMRQQGNVPSSVISSHSMHLGVLATAWHAIQTNAMFTVYYKPRTSPAEFIVPYDQYMDSIKKNYSIEMRFKMRFEGEEAPKQRFTGTIVDTEDADPNRWKNSKWRCLKVRWDETSAIVRPERVSPWKIEQTLSPPALNPVPVPRPKRPRSSPTKLTADPAPVNNGSPLVLQGEESLTLTGTFSENNELGSSEKSCLWKPSLEDEKIDFSASRRYGVDNWSPLGRSESSFTDLLSGFGLKTNVPRDLSMPIGNQANSKRQTLECDANMKNHVQGTEASYLDRGGGRHGAFGDFSMISDPRGDNQASNWSMPPAVSTCLQMRPSQPRELMPKPIFAEQHGAMKPKEGNCKLLRPDQSKGLKMGDHGVSASDQENQFQFFHPSATERETIGHSGSTRSCTKVQKQGSALGRSVDLAKFNNYDELISELDNLFEFKGELKARKKNWLVVYTDDEDDMMLVGDDPWA